MFFIFSGAVSNELLPKSPIYMKEPVARDVEVSLSGVVDMPLTCSDAANQHSTVSNRGSSAYKYCCNTGIPCNCNAGIRIPGQCVRDAYSYCWGVGTPCMCGVGDNLLTDTEELAQVVVWELWDCNSMFGGSLWPEFVLPITPIVISETSATLNTVPMLQERFYSLSQASLVCKWIVLQNYYH